MFQFGSHECFREDWTVPNERGHSLEVSVWHRQMPCSGMVLFVHDMMGSRPAVCEMLAPMLAVGCSVAALDCTASGYSEGTRVSRASVRRPLSL